LPMGLFTFVGPLLVLPFSHKLTTVIAVLVFGRVAAWAVHALLCLNVVPGLRRKIIFSRAEIRPLLAFGGWMTVTNVVGPLMVYLDRFLIGAVLSVAAVAYYATPYEIITKLWIIPSAMVGVLFPAFASSFVVDRKRTAMLFGRAMDCVSLVLFPLTLLLITFAGEGLQLWLGAEFATNSTMVLKWLAIGVYLNSLAQVPFALIQGVGRPDLTAKLHLMELPVYLAFLWWAIHAFGIEGAAVAWTARVFVDLSALLFIAGKCLNEEWAQIKKLTWINLLLLLVLAGGGVAGGLSTKITFVVFCLAGFSISSWYVWTLNNKRFSLHR